MPNTKNQEAKIEKDKKVQVSLSGALYKKARKKLIETEKTWQDLLKDFIENWANKID